MTENSAKWEYLTKLTVDLKEKLDVYMNNNPLSDDGKKQSYNKVINKAVKQFLNENV